MVDSGGGFLGGIPVWGSAGGAALVSVLKGWRQSKVVLVTVIVFSAFPHLVCIYALLLI